MNSAAWSSGLPRARLMPDAEVPAQPDLGEYRGSPRGSRRWRWSKVVGPMRAGWARGNAAVLVISRDSPTHGAPRDPTTATCAPHMAMPTVSRRHGVRDLVI